MKKLSRMLLIHWHYFSHEMIEFDKINFLTGKNASGKTTIIDAMQLVLLSDTSGSYFNKAASGRGNRTLEGYLRGELGDDEDSGFRYLRSGRFTSYIALEFYDDTKNDFFTSGCCFDTYGENDRHRLFFRIDDAIPESEFLISDNGKKIPMDIEGLRSFIRSEYQEGRRYTTTTNRDFSEDLCGKLGGLQPKRFAELLKKAVSFNPNVDIQQFITEFVCGETEKVDTTGMQENIRSYDMLRRESQILLERIEVLSQEIDAFGEYTKQTENEKLYGYLVSRAELDIKAAEKEKAKHKSQRLKSDLVALVDQSIIEALEKNQLQSERDNLLLQLDSDENARRLKEIERQIEEKQTRINQLTEGYESFSAMLANAVNSWQSCISGATEKAASIDLSAYGEALGVRTNALREEGACLLDKTVVLKGADADIIVKAGVDGLKDLSRMIDSYRDSAVSLTGRLVDVQEEIAAKMAGLKKEIDLLEKGGYVFTEEATDLKEAILSKLRSSFGPDAIAVIFAEAAEIPDGRWRNTIEGLLGNKKYYVIVEPEHFEAALQVYEAFRKKNNVCSTGLVDTEKLEIIRPARESGSLAEELETDYHAVRMFIDFSLGSIQKCDSAGGLKKYKAAATDKGFVYQDFAFRQIDPQLWKNPAIGQGGVRLRLEKARIKLQEISDALAAYSSMAVAFEPVSRVLSSHLSGSDAEQIVNAAKGYLELPLMQEAIIRLEADAGAIDRSEIEALRERLDERELALSENDKKIRDLEYKKGFAENELHTLTLNIIPVLETDIIRLANDLEIKYDMSWVSEYGSPRYEREFSARGNAEEISKAFPRELSRSQNSKDTAWTLTRDLRQRYNESYKMGHDVNSIENEMYEQAYNDCIENKLPDYDEKIEDTRQKAYQQFQEDFLSKLQSNIFNAERQINELNANIKRASFGEDTYRFKVSAKPEYKRYYMMIVDEMLLTGGYNLLSEQFNAKYKDEIDELFAIITNDNEGQSILGYEEYEKRVHTFTDYKTYLEFDLEVIKPNGESERLSRTIGKKSGGETQTPFYIAVLASFVQLYRIGREKDANTARLIVFDEAFSKMDGERVIQSIELLRRFGFQAVLSAPPDKIPDIATLVDRNLCVLREGRKTYVCAFDPREWEGFADEE